MTRRERVISALNFKPTDKIPKDLGGMASTGISCFAYADLIDYLGFPKRRIKVFDTGQMLALPDLDVLDALDCDVVMTDGYMTNAYEQDEIWRPFDFNGRLPNGAVRNPEAFQILADGTIIQRGGSKMPPTAVVFNSEHAGNPFDLDTELQKEDLDKLRKNYENWQPDENHIRGLEKTFQKIKDSTDRAIFYNGMAFGLGLPGGMVGTSLYCALEPEYVGELFSIYTDRMVKIYEAYYPTISKYADIHMSLCDDMGTQNTTILSPEMYRKLFFPYYKKINQTAHKINSRTKTFFHCCGAVYDIIDDIIDSEIDILNPVQWSAGGRTYQEWKNKARGRLIFWGGGVDAQHTLPLKDADAVAAETAKVCEYMKQDSGYVFCNIHNILAEISPDKVVAMYRSASRF